MRDRARGADSLAPQEKQPDPDRRSGRGQERHRRRAGAADRSGRRSLHHRGQKRLYSLDVSSLVAGTKFRGEFEERMQQLLDELRKAKDTIIFIDEIHTIVGAGSTQGSLDTANILKPALARGELQTIGATTLDEYRENIEKRLGARTPLPAGGGRTDLVRDAPDSCATSRPTTSATTKVRYTDEALASLRDAHRAISPTAFPRQGHRRARRGGVADASANGARTGHAARNGGRAGLDLRGTPRSGPPARLRKGGRSTPAGNGAAFETGREPRRVAAVARKPSGGDPRRTHRAGHHFGDGHPDRTDHDGRAGTPARTQRLPRRPCHRTGCRRGEGGALDPALARRTQRREPPDRRLPLRRPDGRRQDAAGQGAVEMALRRTARTDPHRHERVRRETQRLASDRLPPGYVGYGEGGQLTEAVRRQPLRGGAVRRDREGASRSFSTPCSKSSTKDTLPTDRAARSISATRSSS